MSELFTDVKGGRGWITLDRPKALNALNLSMIRDLALTLKQWEQDDSISEIIIQSADQKAFCAGGDIKAIYHALQRKDLSLCDAFFREEYALNNYIRGYPKPYISLIDGIAMGGGLGISINGSHRIVTEKALLAMPEASIGFFTDVGATQFLNDTPGSTGLFLGLTGTRLDAADSLWSGLATHFLPSSSLRNFKQELEAGAPLERAIEKHCQSPGTTGFLERYQESIQKHFTQDTLPNIFDSLERDSSSFSQEFYRTLRSKSPTSLAVIFQQLKMGKELSFPEKMKVEFRINQHILGNHDFSEGVRALLIDKDQNPRWVPTRVEDINLDKLKSYFNSLGEKELKL